MDMLVTILLVVLTAILCLPLFQKYKKQKAVAKYIDILPGDKCYPIIGTTWNTIKATRETYWSTIKDRHKKYGPIFRSWLGSIPIVHIYKPEHAQVIFKSNKNTYKGVFYSVFLEWLGAGLVTGSGPKWRHHRKLITPAFHFKMLESYADTFAEKSQHFSDFLEQFAGKGYFEVTQYLNRIAMDIICETAMGVQTNCLDNSQTEYSQSIFYYCTAALRRMYNPILRNQFLFSLTNVGRESKKCLEYIHKFNRQIIQERKEYLSQHRDEMQRKDEFGRKQNKMTFLDNLLIYQETNKFNDDEIEEEVNTFLFAGHETTAYTTCYTFMALGDNPNVMKKIHEELDSIFDGDLNRKITPQDVAKMEYLDRVVKEVLRCYCFIPVIGRQLSEDIEIDGLHIPKEASVIVSLLDLHHDPDHYPDPYKFDPDRFLPENVANRHPFAFVPFSAGPRNCIGQKFGLQNTKTLLAYILRKFSVKCFEKPEDMEFYYEIILKPQSLLHISLEKRTNN